MPRIGNFSERKFADRVHEEFGKSDQEIHVDDLRELSSEAGVEHVGSGSFSTVFEVPGSPDRVAALWREGLSPQDGKRVFYRQRVLSTLFPHNFPKFYFSSGNADLPKQEGKGLTWTLREKINGVNGTVYRGKQKWVARILAFLKGQGRANLDIKYPFKKVIDACKELGIGISSDKRSDNFVLGSDGGECFIDVQMFPNQQIWLPEDDSRILEYMSDQGYDKSDISKMRKDLAHLRELDQEELKERKD